MISSPLSYPTNPAHFPRHAGTSGFPADHPRFGQRGKGFCASVSESYTHSSLSVHYRNADGDSISISIEEQQYKRSLIAAGISGDKNGQNREKLVRYLKEEVAMQKSMLIEITLHGKPSEKEGSVSEKSEIEGLPEYWNAENTSQRIVDFATSFIGLYEGAPQEYVSMIRDAIEEGFSQAREMLGELPKAVNHLVGDTYSLVMEKLDAWEETVVAELQTDTAEA